MLCVNKIGTVRCGDNGFSVVVEPQYRPALTGLSGFGCAQIIWWFDGCDNEQDRTLLTVSKPYVKGPDMLGVFATRSPQRPNPIAASPAQITYVDEENGVVGLAWIDANDGSPVLDIKPYVPSVDRFESPSVPKWCAHWPKCVESSGDFDWEDEFNF